MWIATPQAPTFDPDGSGNTLVTVVYTNGDKTITPTPLRGVDQAQLVAQVQGTILNLNHLDSMATFVATPDLTPITAPVSTVPVLTAAQQAVNALSPDEMGLLMVAALITCGAAVPMSAPIFTATQTAGVITSIKAKLQTNIPNLLS